MFFDLELLKKGGKFSTIWFAATTGIKSIKKTERISVNVVKSGDDILSVIITDSRRTMDRISLVLSSKLFNGLLRIHHAQVSHFLDYVNTFYPREMQRQARLIEIFSEETNTTSSLEVVKPKKPRKPRAAPRKPRAAKPVVEFTPEEALAKQVATWFQLDGVERQFAEIIEEDLPRRVLQPDDRQITLVEEVVLPQTAEEDDEFGDFGPGLTPEEVEALLEQDGGEKRTASEEIGPPAKKKKDAIQEPIIEEPPQVIPEEADKKNRAEKETDEEIFKVPRRVPKKHVNLYVSTQWRKHNINIRKLKNVKVDIVYKKPLRDFNKNIDVKYIKEVDLMNDSFLLYVERIADETTESRRDTVHTPDDVELRKASSTGKGARITPQQLLTPLRTRKNKDIESIGSPSKYKAVEEEPPRSRPIRRNILEEFEPYPQEIQREIPAEIEERSWYERRWPEYESESRKDKLKKYAKRIRSLHEKGQTHIRIPDIADKPSVNRFATASAFGYVLDLAARGYVKLFTQEGSLEFDHLEIDAKLLKMVEA